MFICRPNGAVTHTGCHQVQRLDGQLSMTAQTSPVLNQGAYSHAELLSYLWELSGVNKSIEEFRSLFDYF